MARIKYGLSNVYYAVATAGTGGAITYGTPKALPGAVAMTLDQQGEAVDEYADNILFADIFFISHVEIDHMPHRSPSVNEPSLT